MVLLSLATLALILVTVLLPAQSPSTAPVLLAPSATPTLAMCITEDGAGQAVCWWDAQAQGNGMGTSVVSGDCAPSVVGSDEVSALCINLHARETREETNADGSINTVPNGADLVGECISEKDSQPIEECIRGWLG
jgi:hypothetical protein